MPSPAQQTEHAKSTFYLHSGHSGPNFPDFRTVENIFLQYFWLLRAISTAYLE